MPSVEYRDSAGVCWPIDMRGDGQLAGVGYPLASAPISVHTQNQAHSPKCCLTPATVASLSLPPYDRRRRGATLVGAVRAAAHSLSEWVADTYEE
jgi:hypothetical protein